MREQECPNCQYGVPERKTANQAPQGMYPAPGMKTDDCPQCFYQPEQEPNESQDCPQCFYQPEGEKK